VKTKDIVYLVLAAIIFAGIVVLVYGQVKPKQSARQEVVEVVDPISSEFDDAALSEVTNPARARNFTPPVDFGTGMGNPRPFSPI
jgi:hypothetical protein